MFHDRADAGRQLLAKLPRLDPAETVVIALPRGGVPVAEVIAEGLDLPLDVAIVRKVGHPRQRELAVSAVTGGDSPRLHVNRDVADMAGLTEDDIWALAEPEIAEAERRRAAYVGDRQAWPVRDKVVLLVDDGIATGATMLAAIALLRAEGPRRIVVAVPVAPDGLRPKLEAVAEEVIILGTPRPFHAVGAHYRDFDQVPDAEVTAALARNLALMEARDRRG